MNPPDWNIEDKQESLKKWIEMLNEEARRQFLISGTHIEIFFLFNDAGIMEVVPIVGMDKDDMIHELKKILRERDGYAFIHIAEATARAMDSAAEADSLLVHAESRDGLSTAWFSTVARRGEEKLLLDAVQVDGSKLKGRLTRIFER
jgi:deoxyxylulose-5-phosphate synthase